MAKWQDYKAEARSRGALAAEFYVVLSEPADAAKIPETLPDHLDYQGRTERDGHLVFAGPLSDLSGEETSGAGLIIYRAGSLDEAKALADADPMHLTGARTYVIRRWLINEGRINLGIGLSSSPLSLS